MSSDFNLLDTSFINTQEIQYNIPREKMPPFTSFRVLAALRVNGVQSGFSEQSNLISKYMEEGEGEEGGGSGV